jgi:hypothetical protein
MSFVWFKPFHFRMLHRTFPTPRISATYIEVMMLSHIVHSVVKTPQVSLGDTVRLKLIQIRINLIHTELHIRLDISAT